MHWTGDGRIQITRNLALGAAAIIIALALVTDAAHRHAHRQGTEDGELQAEIDPTPSAMAAEQETDTATGAVQAADQQEEHGDGGATPDRHEDGVLHLPGQDPQVPAAGRAESARFTPWPESQQSTRYGT